MPSANHSLFPPSATLKTVFTLLTLGILVTAAAPRATAQETVPPTTTTPETEPAKKEKDDQQDLSNLSLEDLMKIKVHSVYGASRFLQKVTEAPTSVSIITAEDIKRYGYTTLADAIRSVRGFYVNYTRVSSELGARGFARPGDNNTRVLLLVDGHRISDNIYNAAAIGSGFPIDVDLIDRIEIIRGPSSSLYGTNAFFGVINVITKRGADIDGVEVSTQRASFDTYRARVSYGKQFSSGLDLIFSATLSDSKGPARLYFKEFDSPAANNGIAENADGEDFKQMFANVSWREFSVRGVYSNREKLVPTAAFGSVFNDPGFVDESRGYLDFKYEKSLSRNTEFLGRLYFDHYDLHGDNVFLLPTPSGNIRAVSKYSSEGVWWGAEATVTTSISNRYKFTAGTEFRDNIKQNDKAYFEEPFIVSFDDHHSSREWAGYGEGQFRLTRNASVNAGIRHDHSYVFGGSTNPRFALVYNPLEKTTVKLLYGQAFRAPNVYELYVQHSEARPNLALEPERIKTTEVVVEQYVGDHVRVAASAFSYGISNLITRVVDPATGIQSFINAGRIRSNGFEAEAEVKSNLGLQGLFSYAYQSSRDRDTGQKLTNSPAHMLKLNLNGPIGIKRTFAGLEMQYLGDRRTLTNQTAESFLLTNFTMLSEQIKNRFDLSFSIYNLFDTRYGNPGSAEHRQDIIPQDGRTFRLKFTYRFSGK
jgi:outer membrane receptor for ferrienterochelin and colicins